MPENLRLQRQADKAVAKKPPVQRSTDLAGGHPLLSLQRQVGNSVVAQLIAQREADEELQAKHDFSLQRESEGAEGEDEEVQAQHDFSLQREGDDEEVQMSPDASLQREGEDEEVQMSADAALQREGDDEELQAKHDFSLQRESEDEELQAKHDFSLQRESEGAEGEDEELQAKHDFSLQREGDDEEVQMKADASLQREGEDEEVQAKHDFSLQRKPTTEVGMEGGAVGADLGASIQRLRGSGSPLDGGTRTQMESAFGTSFSDVRVHTGSEASDLNHRVGAHAFTTGSDVFLRDDSYKPGTEEGTRLLSHELTHVVQQRDMSPSGGMQVRPAGDGYEQAADAKASEVLSHLSSGGDGGGAAAAAGGGGGGAQRQVDE